MELYFVACVTLTILSLVVLNKAFSFRGRIFTEQNSTIARGTLKGFESIPVSDDNLQTFVYKDNAPGRLPIIWVKGKRPFCTTASIQCKTLTKDDVGKEFKVLYRKAFLGTVLIIDIGDVVERNNKTMKVLFWVFLALSLLFLAFGISFGISLASVL